MNRLFFFLACCCVSATPAAGDIVIFFEGLRANDAVNTNLTYKDSPWDNAETLMFTGSGDTRITSPFPGSGGDGRNVFLSNINNADLLISGIDTRGYAPDRFTLSFAGHKSATADDMQNLVIEYSSDGSVFNRVLPDGLPPQDTGPGTSGWRVFELTGLSLPATEQLQLRFTNQNDSTASNRGYRLDNISLRAQAVPEPASAAALSAVALAGWAIRRRRLQAE